MNFDLDFFTSAAGTDIFDELQDFDCFDETTIEVAEMDIDEVVGEDQEVEHELSELE